MYPHYLLSSNAIAGSSATIKKTMRYRQPTRRKHSTRDILQQYTKQKSSVPVKLGKLPINDFMPTTSRKKVHIQVRSKKKRLIPMVKTQKAIPIDYVHTSSMKKHKGTPGQYAKELQQLKMLLKNSSANGLDSLKKTQNSKTNKTVRSYHKINSSRLSTAKTYSRSQTASTKKLRKSKPVSSERKIKKTKFETYSKTKSKPIIKKKFRPPSATSKKDSDSNSSSNDTTLKRKIVMPNQLKIKDLKVKSLLGEGAFSKVYLAQFGLNQRVQKYVPSTLYRKHLALKIIPRKKQHKAKNLIWEKLILSELNHPFIVKYYGSFADSKRTCILLEFIIGGEILHHFEQCKAGKFSSEVAKFYVAEIVCTLSYCHSRNYVYRDLKPENILLDKEGHIKLVDFGFARKLSPDQKTYTLCGSKEYVAPEVLLGTGHSFKVDCWSLGVLLYELVVGHLPFDTQECTPYQVLDIIRSTKVYFPSYVDRKVIHVIAKLLKFNPKKRINLLELQSEPWLKDINWKECNKRQLKPPIIPSFSSADDASNFENSKFTGTDKYNDVAYQDLNMF